MLACALSWIVGIATVRPAEACGAPDPTIHSWIPAPNQTGVPTNTRLWVKGRVGQVRLTAGSEIIDTTLTSLSFTSFEAKPMKELAPNTTYTVTAAAPSAQPAIYTFTTGAGADLSPPGAPAKLDLRTREVLQPDTDCSAQSGFEIELKSDAVAGAVLYELQRLEANGYERLAVAEQPRFFTGWKSLPSPSYRIRPIAVTGIGPDETLLPSGAATKSDGVIGEREEEGGCSAVGGGSSALGLVVIAVGLLLPRRRRAMRAVPVALAALVLVLIGVAAPRRAEACSPPAPFFEAVAPKANDKDVPTNTRLWLRGSPSFAEVTLTPAGGAKTMLSLEPLMGQPPIYRAVPPAALQPSTTYTVAIRMLETQRTEEFSFTTGVGADETAPMAPATVQVVTTEILSPPTNCCPSDGYRLLVKGPEVAGAVIYQLEELQGGTFVAIGASTKPELLRYVDTLPSPTFRIRPLSITGASANEAALPTGKATHIDDTVGERPERDEEVDGCAAGSGPSGSALALLLGVGALLCSRRRR